MFDQRSSRGVEQGAGGLELRQGLGVEEVMVFGASIDMVSTGPDREHTIVLRHPYSV